MWCTPGVDPSVAECNRTHQHMAGAALVELVGRPTRVHVEAKPCPFVPEHVLFF
jgi:hypothetical protein